MTKGHTERNMIRTHILGTSALLAGLALYMNYSQVVRADPADQPAGPPANLRCEYRVNPVGIDVTIPRLSWEVNDPRRGAAQTAYQVVVSTDPAFTDTGKTVWDTGKVESDQSIHLAYAGQPLESGRRYFWKVRTWDNDDRPSPCSEPACWEMGLLDAADWSAKWIGTRQPVTTQAPTQWGDWIWDAKDRGEQQTAFLRKTFKIEDAKTVVSAVIKITTDDQFALYLNGQTVGERGGWNIVNTYTVTNTLQTGNNVLAVRATNGPGDYGMVFAMRIELTDGKVIDIRSDETWFAANEEHRGWIGLDFDDSAWKPAVIVARYGDPPWNELRESTKPPAAVCLRKEFKTADNVTRARAYVCGLGIYELRLNGQKVGNDCLTPGWTHYEKRLQYQTYDVTNLLNRNDNVIGVILGNGWWSGGFNWKRTDENPDEVLRLICQLVIEYADGSVSTVVTDKSWQAYSSPITRNTFYHGETCDARLEMPGWDAPGFDAGQWWPTFELNETTDLLRAQRCEPIRVTQEIPPMQISTPDKNVHIFDFGQNAAGRARLKVTGAEPGTRIRLRFGEELDPNGRLYRENYRSAEATDFYICKGADEEIWEPIFTYRGFRYCEITGLPGEPTPETLVYRVLHSDTPPAGRFECSNWLINRILDNVNWGLRSNIHSVPTDCPQRDERLGWMGDAQAFAHTSCFLRQMASFYSKWMFDVTDSQNDDGAVADVSPAREHRGAAKPGWGDAVVIVPYTVYRFYSDTRVIEENYDAMVAWVEYMRGKSKGDLYEEKGYGDWVAVEESPSEWIGSAFYFYSTKLLAEMAAAIGKSDDAARYSELADRIAKAFNAEHLDKETGNYVTGTQTCNILPLFFGITSDDRTQAVVGNIARNITDRGTHLSTGFMGTTYLMTLLADRGQQDLAYQLAVQTTYPSWGHMILNGATTIWERWDTDKQGPQMNSRNHFAFGTVARWFFEDLAGINLDPQVPGFKRIVIRPRPVRELTFARATHASMYGLIHSGWRFTDAGFLQYMTIPANTSAEVFVPTLGHSKLTITDDATGRVVLKRGQPTASEPDVKFLRMEKDFAVFDVTAGTYAFSWDTPRE